MRTEKDDRKVEKSYLIENWLTLNKTPFSQWKTETQHKNLLCPSQQQAVQEKRKERQTVKDWEQAGDWRFSICNLWDMT